MNSSARWAVLPLIIFLGLGLLFWRGLSGNPSTLPSTLIDKPVPAFSLPPVAELSVPGLADPDLRRGEVSIVNIWASWCGPCRQEHPVLMDLATRSDINVVGINNKDDGGNAARFIGALGMPYSAVGADTTGRITIDWGGYGVPETFVVDGTGVIRHKHVGPLSPADIAGKFGAAIEAAKKPLPQN
jgi:cytochrome c biogenesis protein CcmG, thiol:disulfide interchange protein DsbE